MKITSIRAHNFRLLKDTTVSIEEDLTLIVGRNNTGKTSLLKILDYFINDTSYNYNEKSFRNKFNFEDFSIEAQDEICKLEISQNNPKLKAEEYEPISIRLRVNIEYREDEDISNAASLILDLESELNKLIVEFQLKLSYEDYEKMLAEYAEHKQINPSIIFVEFIKDNFNRYFKIKSYAVDPTDEKSMKEIDRGDIGKVLAIEVIDAKRDVDNNGKARTLADLARKHYDAESKSSGLEVDYVNLHNVIKDTDGKLTDAYKPIFETIVTDIKDMSYNSKEAEIEIKSKLNEDRLFSGNTTVTYKHDATSLPEDYNGLGYLNLFAIIFNINIKINSLKNSPALIKILFVEEPEAHTHPQMQYIFIKNIKNILKKYATAASISLHTIMSSHSPQIVSQCDFNDVKYFKRETITDGEIVSDEVRALDLSSLKERMVTSEDADEKAKQANAYRFIKKYITLDKAELFFADKAILIEGDTERILMSAMMEKVDKLHDNDEEYKKVGCLLSQSISILEVGAFSQHFKELIDFLGIKTLIITDLDTVDTNGKSVEVADINAIRTSNSSLKTFFAGKTLSDIKALPEEGKILSSDDGGKTWRKSTSDEEHKIKLAFQVEENNYIARSFEDAFLAVNMCFVANNKENFSGLKRRGDIEENSQDYYSLAEKCINKKTAFALDVLLNGGENNEKWEVPKYIKEGLEWIQQ